MLATGGTIAAAAASPDETVTYDIARDVGALLKAVPPLLEVAEVRGEQVLNLPSSEIDDAALLAIARRVDAVVRADDADGVVVTHGTDTLEETAYFLDLVVGGRKPVALTGALRPASALGADGPRNLFAAVRVAAAPGATDRGVLVVLNDRIAGARSVTKARTSGLDAFRAPEEGFAGAVAGDEVVFFQPPRPRRAPFASLAAGPSDLPRVDIVYGHQGMGTRPFDAAIDDGAAGIVYAATGNGTLPATVRSAAARAAAAGVVFVRASRTGGGVVSERPFDTGLGTVAAGSLNPQKARVLLRLALTRTRDSAAVRRLFAES